ncbi:Heme-binding-like protein [Drosera capensis]
MGDGGEMRGDEERRASKRRGGEGQEMESGAVGGEGGRGGSRWLEDSRPRRRLFSCGKITVETPKYEVVKSTDEYEIRQYAPAVVAEVTFDEKKENGFLVLANYIGALGKPQNARPEKIAMTAPVVTKAAAAAAAEKIAMTAPVVTTKAGGSGDESSEKKLVTMQFILPSKYQKAEEAPRPLDERVVIRDEERKKLAVVTFSGVATEKVVEEKAEKLRKSLERDGETVVGEHMLAGYNPPWTLPPLRTNEVMIPVA